MRLGIASLLAGMALYVGAALVMLSDDPPRPGWLTTLWLVATALVVAGLLALVSGAVAAAKERR